MNETMNEKIKELYDKAWLKVDPNNPQETFTQAFAESIVKECASIVEGSPWNLPRGYKAVDQAELVKKHFGVE